MTLNLLVVVLLLLADLSLLISPSKAPFLGMMGIGFEVLTILNLVFVVCWLFTTRKAWCVVSLAALLVSSCSLLSTWSHLSSSTDDQHNRIRVLSYNSMGLQGSTPIKKNDVLRYVKESGADLVFLQEYCVRKDRYYPTFEGVKKYLNPEYSYTYFDFFLHNSQQQFGLAIYSRYPLINKQSIPFEGSYNGACRCDMVVPNDAGGKDTFRLINVHLESNSFTRDELELDQSEFSTEGVAQSALHIAGKLGKAYSKRAVQVQLVEQEIQSSPYPVIVCGDFNDVPVSYTYHHLIHGLKDSFLESGWLKRGHTFVKRGMGIRIDYILHSPSLQSSEFLIDKVNYSDHFPVQTTLSW